MANKTSAFNLTLPFRGENPGTWDIPVNTNTLEIDAILKGLRESFSSISAPSGNPTGSLWYDSSALNSLKIRKPIGYKVIADEDNIVDLIRTAVVLRDLTAPAAPTGLRIDPPYLIEKGQTYLYAINCYWDAVEGILGPYIYSVSILTEQQELDGSPVEEFLTTNNSYTFKPLLANNYIIKIKSKDAQGNLSVLSATTQAGISNQSQTAPAAPFSVTALAGIRSLIIKWKQTFTQDIVSYEIHASLISNFTPDIPAGNADSVFDVSTTLKWVGNANIATIDRDILPATKYYIKVRAKNSVGLFSTFSTVAEGTTGQIGTTDIVANAISADHIQAGAITADELAANAVTAGKIAADSVDATHVKANAITAAKISSINLSVIQAVITNLAALNADLGSITAGKLVFSNASSYLRSGQTAWNSGIGFFLGTVLGVPKMSIGNSDGANIRWDGTSLKISGDVIIGAAPDGSGGIPASQSIEKNYVVSIESTNGDVFRVGQPMTTLLIAHVFQGDTDVTNLISESRFKWRRVSYFPQPPPDDDNTWNSLYASGYKQISITTNTVASRATFHCDIMSP